MNKKILIGLLVLVLIVVVAIVSVKVLNGEDKKEENNASINEINTVKNERSKDNEVENETDEDEETSDNKNVLVVYFSAQSHTKAVAEKIADNLDADIFELVPEDEYTEEDLDYNADNARVSREHDDESLRDIKLRKTKVDNWDDYDTVLIDNSIWWGEASWVVNNFIKENDFTGKTVIPFCTSASSSLGESGELLEEMADSGDWKEGHRFSSSASDSDIKSWTDTLK